MRIFGLLVLAALLLWTHPWSAATATATPFLARFENSYSLETVSRCPAGYRKHTITARCVRAGGRLPWF